MLHTAAPHICSIYSTDCFTIVDNKQYPRTTLVYTNTEHTELNFCMFYITHFNTLFHKPVYTVYIKKYSLQHTCVLNIASHSCTLNRTQWTTFIFFIFDITHYTPCVQTIQYMCHHTCEHTVHTAPHLYTLHITHSITLVLHFTIKHWYLIMYTEQSTTYQVWEH